MAGRSALDVRLDALAKRLERIEAHLGLAPLPLIPVAEQNVPPGEAVQKGGTPVEPVAIPAALLAKDPEPPLKTVEPRFDWDTVLTEWETAGGLEGQRIRARR